MVVFNVNFCKYQSCKEESFIAVYKCYRFDNEVNLQS